MFAYNKFSIQVWILGSLPIKVHEKFPALCLLLYFKLSNLGAPVSGFGWKKTLLPFLTIFSKKVGVGMKEKTK